MTPPRIVTDCARGCVGSAVQMREPMNVISSATAVRDAEISKYSSPCSTQRAEFVPHCCANASKGCGELDMVSCVRLVRAARACGSCLRLVREKGVCYEPATRIASMRWADHVRFQRHSLFGEHHAIDLHALEHSAHARISRCVLFVDRDRRARRMRRVTKAASTRASRVDRRRDCAEFARNSERIGRNGSIRRSEDRPNFFAGVCAASEDRRPEGRSIEVAHFDQRR